jgi:hypothetical protein
MTQLPWHTILYHKIRIHLPIFLVLINLSLIYTVYLLEFLLPLMNGESFLLSNTFIGNTLENKKQTKIFGTCLFIIINWLLFWLLVSYFRTIFTDPGYLPDPMQLEIQLIYKNLDYQPNDVTERRICTRSDSSALDDSEEGRHPGLYSMSEKRQKILKSFQQFIDEGPMTCSEITKYKHNLEKYVVPPSTKRSLSASDLYVSSENSVIVDNTDIFENFRGIDLSKLVLCSYCIRWKVERSHHCKQCGKCVLKMDHHCPWVANCIGFYNHKYFCLLVWYGFFLSLIIFVTFWEIVFKTYANVDSGLRILSAFYFFVYLLNFGFLCFMVYLFRANYGLVLSNQTVIEKAEKEKFGQTKFNFYDKGKYNNFKAVFGESPFLWFFPFNINDKGKGLIY